MAITYSKGKGRPGKVDNPARGQLNREDVIFPVPVRAREFGLAREFRGGVLYILGYGVGLSTPLMIGPWLIDDGSRGRRWKPLYY